MAALAGPRRRALLLVCLAAWSAIALLLFLRLRGSGPDDFFITYRYARNLAQGHGFTYNPGERVFGTTDPGLGLLLGALHALLGVEVPVLAAALFALSLVALAVLLLAAAGDRRGQVAAALGGTALVSSSLLWSNAGAAALPALLLLALAASVAPRSESGAGALAALATWMRPDAGVGLVALGLLRWWERRRPPVAYGLVGAALVGSGLLLALLYFGQPLPNTLGAKIDMASAAGAEAATHAGFWRRAALPLGRHLGTAYPLLLAAGAVGAGLALRRGPAAMRLLALHGLAIAVAYPLLGVPFFSWYVIPCVVALLLGIGQLCATPIRRGRGAGLATVAAVGLAAALLVHPLRTGYALTRHGAPTIRETSYRRAGEWIRRHSPPQASIAYVEIGMLGWASERPILDLMGLVSPWVRPYVARGDLLGALRARPSDFVLAHSRGRMAPVVESRWFRQRYREVLRLEEPQLAGRPRALVVYARPTRPLEGGNHY